MSISEKIEQLLRKEYAAGATHCILAKKYSINRQNLTKLLSKQRKFNQIRLKTFDKMFPKAIIDLLGETSLQKNKTGDIIGSNSNIGNNNSIEANNFLSKNDDYQSQKKSLSHDDMLILEHFNNPKNRREKLKLLLEIDENQTQKTEGKK